MEIFGAHGTGKTQLSHILNVMATQHAKARRFDPHKSLDKIILARVLDSTGQGFADLD
jgi:hypothetical protein